MKIIISAMLAAAMLSVLALTSCAVQSRDDYLSGRSASPSATPSPMVTVTPKSTPKPTATPTPTPKVDKNDPLLVLANPSHPLPEGYTVKAEKVQGEYLMDERAAPFMRNMIAAAKADGVSLIVCSSYRSMDKQVSLYSRKVKEWQDYGYGREEAERKAATIVAKPGTSEHQAGLAADIVTRSYQTLDSGFENTEAFRWLSEHAVEYGFVLRFPKDKQEITGIIYEPWHYRYVGLEHAAEIKALGLCLEEYLEL